MISTTYASAVIDSPTKTKVIDNPSNVNAAPLYNGISVVGLSGGKTGILYKEQDTKNWYYKIVDPHGTPTFFSQINTPSYMGKRSANFFYMKAFALAGEKTLITWEGTSGGTDRKTGNPNQFIILDGNGDVLVGPVDINNVTATYNGDTDVAELSNGNIAFVWQGEAFNYLLRIFNISSKSFTSDPITTIESSQSPHTIIANKNGTFLVAQKSEGTLYHNDGTQKKASFPISVTGNDKKQGVALSNGSFAILYNRDESPNYEVRIISDTGSVTSISGDTSALDGYPVLVGLKNGGFLVADTFTDGSGRWFYKAREYKNDGTVSKDWGVVDSDYVREFGVFWSRYEGGFGMYNDATGNLVHHAISSVSNNADLSNLTLSQGTLAPVFASGTTTYTASVDNSVSSVTVTPTVADSTATVVVNGVPVTSGSASIPLNTGSNTITIVVTAQNGNTKTYSIVITRGASTNANASSIASSVGDLTPAFTSAHTDYTVNVPHHTTEDTITVIPEDPGATVNIEEANPLQVGENIFKVTITAPDGVTKKTYTITVMRAGSNNANLQTLQVSPGTLKPIFSPDINAYTVHVARSVSAVTLTANPADREARVSMNGKVTTEDTITLDTDTMVIPIVVTAQDGGKKTYTVTVEREKSGNAHLRNLTVNHGTLTPAFSSETAQYQLNVGHSISSINLTAEGADPDARIAINGKVTTSDSISLNVGTTSINIVVTAPNGEAKTYILNVTRATAPSSGGGGGGSRGSGRDRSDTTTQPVKEPEAPKPPIEETQKPIIVPSDVTGHWAQERISEAIRRGIVTGYPDGTFRPNEPVTRLQWISFLVRALHLQGEGARLNFTDKGEIPAWGQSDVAVAVANGLISGYPDGSFRPNQEITRAEMVSILARILKLKPDKGLQSSFSDSKAIPAWAQEDVAAVANKGLIQGRGNNVFAPNASTKRAEAIVLLLTMLDKK